MVDTPATHHPAQAPIPQTEGPVYSPVARAFHWSVAALVLMLIPIGIYMTSIEWGPQRNNLYSGHKLFGFLALLLIAGRVLWRLTQGAPPPYAGLTSVKRRFSGGLHHLMYLLLVVVPVLGWVGVSAFPALTIFGAFNLPSIWPADEAVSKQVLNVHKVLALLLGGFVVVHISAALMHRFVHKDGVFRRMWPGRG